jgi:amino acid permease
VRDNFNLFFGLTFGLFFCFVFLMTGGVGKLRATVADTDSDEGRVIIKWKKAVTLYLGLSILAVIFAIWKLSR